MWARGELSLWRAVRTIEFWALLDVSLVGGYADQGCVFLVSGNECMMSKAQRSTRNEAIERGVIISPAESVTDHGGFWRSFASCVKDR
jgi:hypothetical protein